MSTPTFNLADLFELVADAVPDRVAIVAGADRRTYRELDGRANRLAHHLAGTGVGPGDFVAIYAWNRAEWVEAMIAAYKIRAVPVNVNYRYVEAELRYLFGNANFAAVVVERGFAGLVGAVRAEAPALRSIVVLADGTPPESAQPLAGEVDYEQALATAPPGRGFGQRGADDLYGLYTGGTTGAPKCVLWRSEDIFRAAMFGGNPLGEPFASPIDAARHAAGPHRVFLSCAPLMHGAAQWPLWINIFAGATTVVWTGRGFDPDQIWALVEREKVLSLAVVGDAMARPLIEHLTAQPGRHDVSSLAALSSGGAPLSAAVREQISAALPGIFITDGFGSSEMGAAGRSTGTGSTARFAVGDTTAVLDEDLEPVGPGSGVVGRLARRGAIPLRYHGDEAKTAATFLTDRHGVRWAVPGDWATVEADGTIIVLGRGSACINSGGEKIFPDEVEAALTSHPDVFDVAVVGVPDARFGERVVALVTTRPGHPVDVARLTEHCRGLVAGYKVPKQIHVVTEIPRTAAGKIDIRRVKNRAEQLALAAQPAGTTVT